jgi:hypothetical protein
LRFPPHDRNRNVCCLALRTTITTRGARIGVGCAEEFRNSSAQVGCPKLDRATVGAAGIQGFAAVAQQTHFGWDAARVTADGCGPLAVDGRRHPRTLARQAGALPGPAGRCDIRRSALPRLARARIDRAQVEPDPARARARAAERVDRPRRAVRQGALHGEHPRLGADARRSTTRGQSA